MIDKRFLIENFINEDLLNFARRHNYSSEFFDLFSNKLEKEDIVEDNLKGKMDRRTLAEYHKEIAFSWVIEDFIIDNSNGKYARAGCDSKRSFLTSKITNDSDLVDLRFNRPIEVVVDYVGYMKKHGHVNLRHNKLLHLVEENSVVLLIDIQESTYFIKSAKKFPRFKIEHFTPFGGKPVYRIYLNEDINKFQSINHLFKRLESVS